MIKTARRVAGSSPAISVCIVVYIWTLAMVASDAFLIPHRRNEISTDNDSEQQLEDLLKSQLSRKLPTIKNDKKGLSVSVNVLLDGEDSANKNPSTTIISSNSAHCKNTTGEKVDCASYGITKDECLARDCCYTETRDGPTPWCYLPETSLVAQCRGREESRLQCGYYNIRRGECEQLGCCWRPTSTSGTPWCYQADSDTEVPSRPTGPTGNVDVALPVQCGEQPIEPNVNLRIVGGVEAVPHSWPWIVSLQNNGDHQCGGSLINENWVLSAAHCHSIFDELNTSSVVVGLHNTDSPEPEITERISVEKIIINDKYQSLSSGLSNDVMLIKLSRPVRFNRAVIPVCLPRPFQAVESGTRCWSAGWGTMEAGAPTGSTILNQVLLPIIDNDVCNQPEFYNNAIEDTMVCAGYQEGGKDSCQGDSGGPLMCNEGGRWTLFGIVSWGDGCGGVNKPGLYGRTSAYLKWINKQIRDN